MCRRVVSRRVRWSLAVFCGLFVLLVARSNAAPVAATVPPPFAAPAKVVEGMPRYERAGQPTNMTAVGDILFFTAPFSGQLELWLSDGTTEGSEQVADIRPGVVGSEPSNLANIDGTLYFAADDGTHGRELWRSDGTPTGTGLVADIVVGVTGSGIDQLTVVGNLLFFTATGAEGGNELWRTDGTLKGTQQVADIAAGPADSGVHALVAFHDALYFTTSTGKLWRTMQGGASVEVVSELGGEMRQPDSLLITDRYLFMRVAGTEVWRTDGSSAGTIRLQSNEHGLSEFTTVDARLYFLSDDTLWESDGTQAGTMQTSVSPSIESFGNLIEFQHMLYFTADRDYHYSSTGVELWRTDGTEDGTTLVKDIEPSENCQHEGKVTICLGIGSYPQDLIVAGRHLFFTLESGSNGPASDLWQTDGTNAGTTIVKSIIGVEFNVDYGTDNLTATGERLLFTMGKKLWWTSSVTAESVRIAEVPLDYTVVSPILLRDDRSAYFLSYLSGSIDGLFRVGNDAQPTLIHGLYPPDTTALVDLGSQFFFAARSFFDGTDANPDQGNELWRSDGTQAGTFQVKDIRPGWQDSVTTFSAQTTAAFRSMLYFRALEDQHGQELWRSDGTETGTTLVADIAPGTQSSSPDDLTPIGDVLYFAATDHNSVRGLWRTDGTATGTMLVRDFPAIRGTSIVTHLTALGGRVIFMVKQAGQPAEVWTSDGTADGTTRLATARGTSAQPEQFVELGGALFFALKDEQGIELWRTDGTAAGTTRFFDINPGTKDAAPTQLAMVSDRLLFSADDGTHGQEPWISDGTIEGTVLLQDLAPGAASSNPAKFIRAGMRMYFVAQNSPYGRDLWSIPYIFEVRSRIYLPQVQH